MTVEIGDHLLLPIIAIWLTSRTDRA